MPDVICVGQAVLDCITRGKEALPYKPNVYRAETIRLHTGGDAVNEAMALAALGHKVGVVCGLGRDVAGDMLASALDRAGVDTSRVSRLNMDTPIANLQVALDGSRVSVNSEATRLKGYRVDPEAVKGARLVSLASLFRPPLEDFEVISVLVRAAKASGAIVCADTKLPLREPLQISGLRDVLPMIDYIFPNEKEAAYYTGQRTLEDMARAFVDLGVGNAVVKAGAEGCCVCGGGETFLLPAVPVPNVVDTTGAGDHFVAGFIDAVLRGESLRGCAESGLRLAARAITHTGGGE